MRCVTLFLIFLTHLITAQSAKEIVQRADSLLRGESNHATLTMSIIRPTWKRGLSMNSWSKGDHYALIRITAPARDQGTAFLKRYTEMWQWLPSIQRVIKIPPSMMNQSWMGSDFTNDDLVREASVVEDYDHTLLSDTVFENKDVYRIQMIPKPQAPVVWSKVIVWISKNDFIQRRLLFYGERGNLVNQMNLSEIKEMDGRNIPTIFEMIPVDKPGHKTVLEYKIIDFNTPIDDSFFSLQNLRSGK